MHISIQDTVDEFLKKIGERPIFRQVGLNITRKSWLWVALLLPDSWIYKLIGCHIKMSALHRLTFFYYDSIVCL